MEIDLNLNTIEYLQDLLYLEVESCKKHGLDESKLKALNTIEYLNKISNTMEKGKDTNRKMSAANRDTLAKGIVLNIEQELENMKQDVLNSEKYKTALANFKEEAINASTKVNEIWKVIVEKSEEIEKLRDEMTSYCDTFRENSNCGIVVPYYHNRTFSSADPENFTSSQRIDELLRQFEGNYISKSKLPRLNYQEEDSLKAEIDNAILMSDNQDPKHLFDVLTNQYLDKLKSRKNG